MQCRLCLPFKNISELKKKPRMCLVQDLLKILKIGFLVTQVVSILGHNAGDKCYILFSALQPKFNEIIQFYMLNLSFFFSFRLSSPFLFLFFPFLFLVYPFFPDGYQTIINYRILSMDIAKTLIEKQLKLFLQPDCLY